MDIRKLLLPLTLAAGACVAPVASADDDYGYEPRSYMVTARVVRAEPIIRYVRVRDPRRDCWDETYVESVPRGHGRGHDHGRGYGHTRHGDYYYDDRRGYYDGRRGGSNPANNALLGGIVGGVIGHQFGDGRGKDVATIAGALIGASMAHGGDGPRTVVDQKRTRTRCTEHYDDREEERIEGYRVTYVYDGQHYVTRMDHDPGSTVRVAISARVIRD